jgi:hypothetical protein
MRVMRTPFRGLVALGLLVAACSGSLPSDAPGPGSGSGRPDAARLPVYEGVLRHLVGADLGGRWRHVYVASSICPGAAEAEERGDCPGSFGASEQAELAGRLRDLHGDVRFVDADEVRELTQGIFDGHPRGNLPVRGAVLLRVGRIETEGGGLLSVPGSYYCGGLCAGGATWLLRRRDAAWEVTGPKDGQWIS